MKHFTCFLRVGLPMLFVLNSTIVLSQTSFWETTSLPKAGSVMTVAINSKGHILAALGNNLIYRSTNNGNTWIQVGNPNIGYISSGFAVTPEDNFLIGGLAGIFLSTDEGNTWSRRASPTDYLGNSYSVASFVATPDSLIYAGTLGYGIYYSDNLGYSWYRYGNIGSNGYITSLACKSKGYVFANTSNGLFESNINGSAWAWLGYFGYIRTIVLTSSSNVFLATSGEGVYRSVNGGSTFTPSNNGLTTLRTTAMVANAEDHLFVGIDSAGVYRSFDNGNTWVQINSGMTDLTISSLVISPNGYFFAGTKSGVIYRSKQPTTAVERFGFELPESFSLGQNYPNPFNPSTTIEFSLPRSSYTTLKIFNLLGEEVAILVSQEILAGTHKVAWDATNIPSGIYFYRLQAGKFTETKKLIMLR